MAGVFGLGAAGLICVRRRRRQRGKHRAQAQAQAAGAEALMSQCSNRQSFCTCSVEAQANNREHLNAGVEATEGASSTGLTGVLSCPGLITDIDVRPVVTCAQCVIIIGID